MPAHITHSIFGERVLAGGISEQTTSGASVCGYPLNRLAYEWGLQGPDLLFFATLAGNKKLPHCGRMMHHQNVDRLFMALQQYAVEIKDTCDFRVVYSYILGFCCHYVLDKNCHPYVFFEQSKREINNPRLYSVHHKVESDIDSALAERRLGISPRQFRMPDAVMHDDSVCLPICGLFSYLLTHVYDISTQPQELIKCFQGARRYFRYIIDRGGRRFIAKAADLILFKRGLVFHMLRVCGYDITVMNDDHRPWANLLQPEMIRTESFEELFDNSAVEAAELIGKTASLILSGTPAIVTSGYTFDNGNPQSPNFE